VELVAVARLHQCSRFRCVQVETLVGLEKQASGQSWLYQGGSTLLMRFLECSCFPIFYSAPAFISSYEKLLLIDGDGGLVFCLTLGHYRNAGKQCAESTTDFVAPPNAKESLDSC
jgi:hypothetical protein